MLDETLYTRESLVSSKLMGITHSAFHFDGHEFLGGSYGKMDPATAPFFDIAYRALRGDESAIAIAKACGLYIMTTTGALYVDYR